MSKCTFKLFLLVASLVFLSSSAAATTINWERELNDLRDHEIQDEDAKLRQLMDVYWRWQLDVYPELD
jgi:hypothetical protein